MKGCRPLKDREIVAGMATMRGQAFELRNKALIVLGCFTGFRASELLCLRVKDVVQAGRIVDIVTVPKRCMKANKEGRSIPLNFTARMALYQWVYDGLFRLGYFWPGDYVFQSRASGNRAISLPQGYRIIKDALRAAGVTGPTGTHCMRKTFAKKQYEYYLETAPDPLRATQKALGHSDARATERYLESVLTDLADAVNAMSIAGIEQEVHGLG